MGKNTNILIGAGALAVVYYLYNASKSSASVSPNGATLPPISTIPNKLVDTTPVRIVPEPPYPVKIYPDPYFDDSLAKAEAKRLAEIDRLAEIKAYEEENARLEAARQKENDRQKAYLAEIEKKRLENEAAAKAAEAAREKAMNAFMYPTCPDGFEFYQNNCMPTYVIVENKAKRGEGLVLRDFKSNTTTLVQTCPAEYVKQGINCTPRSALSPQQLQVISMEEAGMVQTSDGQWYTNAASAAAAQAIIDAIDVSYDAYGRPIAKIKAYSARQSSINDAICSIDRDGFINNPYSTYTNGMSLSKYIGEFKVTSGELNIARATCPNSFYSTGHFGGGGTSDDALGYKEPQTKPCVQVGFDCRNTTYNTIQIPIDDDCNKYQPEMPPCAPPRGDEFLKGFEPF
jgi:hypothetical protein